MEKSYLSFEVKAADEYGVIEGYAGYFNNVDRQGDILLKGSLQSKSVKVPLLAHHDPREIIGSAIVTEDEKGYRYKGVLAVTSQSETVRKRAEEYYHLVKEGHLNKNSIGYVTKDHEWKKHTEGNKEYAVRLLKSVELLEVSLVPIPANDRAVVTGIKTYTENEVKELIRSLEERILLLEKQLEEKQVDFHFQLHGSKTPDLSLILAKRMGLF